MKIDVERMIDLKLTIEGILILDCLYTHNKDLLVTYITSISKIPQKVFDGLVADGWLTSTDTYIFTLEGIKLTDKYQVEYIREAQMEEIPFKDAFDALRIKYPKKTSDGRRLHSDLARCKTLYRKAITVRGRVSAKKHEMILDCLQLELNDRKKTHKSDYLQGLPAWLYQKNWEIYEDDLQSHSGQVQEHNNDNSNMHVI